MNPGRVSALLFAVAAFASDSAGDSKRLGSVDFFGYRGLDVQAIEATLPVRVGDPFPGARSRDELVRLIAGQITKAIGRGPTDIKEVCCDSGGNWMLYVGLPGSSFRPLAFHPAPSGANKLSRTLVQSDAAVGKAIGRAIVSGDGREDDSQGFALLEDPDARARQLAFRKEVLLEEESVFTVLDTSSSPEQRAMAATAVGYARRPERQIAALVDASLDENGDVRNNAVRALGVLLRADPSIASKIPAQLFIQLLASGLWEDHNKASFVLGALSEFRDPALLEQLRTSALDSLIETARWHKPGHSTIAKLILGRMAGMEESQLDALENRDRLEAVIASLQAEKRQ